MTSLRPMTCSDLFDFNAVNFDGLTETFSLDFYYGYLEKWPQYQVMARDSNGFCQGYMIGKVEGEGNSWHAHVSAVTVAPESRRLGLGGHLMDILEEQAIQVDEAYFVDLFVRASNQVAVKMYEKLGYVIYRTITEYEKKRFFLCFFSTSFPLYSYYSGPVSEDGLDMRKALPRDKTLKVSSLFIKECDRVTSEPEWQ